MRNLEMMAVWEERMGWMLLRKEERKTKMRDVVEREGDRIFEGRRKR